MNLNIHFKDASGAHRIVEGSLEMVNDPATLKLAIAKTGIRIPARNPVLGLIHGSKHVPLIAA